ncbi:hypothetical protein F7731_20330 [Cytobacillus depressus]|uniref:Uncharacterized protein n=1 Tax=Cytobacillus depressus TaxID=1602942 RepID=A0A6L3V217_9BACI|nr:hypothetical protein [Cytobacillus depressus]KAB2330137.1 hypothetical protein F7731_20330 [Cytobacillus depressus]
MNNWMTALLNTRMLQNVFGRRRSNRGMIWATLLGLGVSAAAIGLNRNRNNKMMNSLQNVMNNNMMKPLQNVMNNNMMKPLQNVMNNVQTQFKGQIPDAVLAEFAKELAPGNNSLTNK